MIQIFSVQSVTLVYQDLSSWPIKGAHDKIVKISIVYLPIFLSFFVCLCSQICLQEYRTSQRRTARSRCNDGQNN